jgi:Fic-DOC domain mobile mystery protein B
VLWSRQHKIAADQLLQDTFIRKLHCIMFQQVWSWAGRYRKTERNLGWAPHEISMGVRALAADAQFWIAPDAQWISQEEAVIRIHHRLVAIHPFPNGNGRHARLYADMLNRALDLKAFTWGRSFGDDPAVGRGRYIAALRKADVHSEDLNELLNYAQS